MDRHQRRHDKCATGKTSAPQAGFAAPDFTLKTPDGEEYTLSELKGNAVLGEPLGDVVPAVPR